MADEQGRAVLNLQSKQRQPGRPSGAGAQSSALYRPWLWVALGAAGAGVLLVLLRAVMGLSVWVSQLQISCDGRTRGALSTLENNETRTISSTECSSCLEDFRSLLKQNLCESHKSSLAEGSRCKLCPRDWRPHGDKCYWLSEERKAWNRSHDDCLRRSSQMLVIQNQEEMNFTQDVIRGETNVWIGLRVTAPGGWTWVDGSPLNPACFSVLNSAEGYICARITGSQVQAEPCDSPLKWICQKEAAVI